MPWLSALETYEYYFLTENLKIVVFIQNCIVLTLNGLLYFVFNVSFLKQNDVDVCSFIFVSS